MNSLSSNMSEVHTQGVDHVCTFTLYMTCLLSYVNTQSMREQYLLQKGLKIYREIYAKIDHLKKKWPIGPISALTPSCRGQETAGHGSSHHQPMDTI